MSFKSRQLTPVERINNFNKISKFIEENVAQHEASFDENNIRDFVDLHIKTSRDHKDDDSTDFTSRPTSIFFLLKKHHPKKHEVVDRPYFSDQRYDVLKKET